MNRYTEILAVQDPYPAKRSWHLTADQCNGIDAVEHLCGGTSETFAYVADPWDNHRCEPERFMSHVCKRCVRLAMAAGVVLPNPTGMRTEAEVLR